MLFPNDHRHCVETQLIGGELVWQPNQSVAVALDFIPAEGAVNYRNIDAGVALAK